MSKIVAAAFVAGVLALFAVVGAASWGATGVVIAAGLYFIGLIGQGTAQTIVLGAAVLGALWGCVVSAGTLADAA